MRKSHEEEGVRWLEQAEEDLITANYLMEKERYYMVCFLSQQIVEKSLKAYLYFKGEELVIGHSVQELCEWAERFDREFAETKEKIAILDSYYMPTRYPNSLPSSIPAKVFRKVPAEEALKLAKEVFELVKNKTK
jgi:HEPN domain-containing protein